ncbi:hypothetical protein OSC27_02105 [Microbacterium sp. STN6]|uniref:hypothetical protein n=1 Tax=Microbacterium sp. STN6 TaxID=2995588 RepID=UPI002260E50F|nr:hypothetical protein [Microbacterium sp. STN6]MCX7521066.1 hypothetical protein [Microbacterium sp. STN6]
MSSAIGRPGEGERAVGQGGALRRHPLFSTAGSASVLSTVLDNEAGGRRLARHDRGVHSIRQSFEGNGLFLRRRDLLALGHTDGQIRAAMRRGIVIRARQGWYALATASTAAVQAVRVGGRLTGLSALKTYGHWTPTTKSLHVVVPAKARALRTPHDMRKRRAATRVRGCRVTWHDSDELRAAPTQWRDSVVDALAHVLRTADRVTAIVCLDAALHARQEGLEGITRKQLDELFATAPRRVQTWKRLVDGRAEAGGETEFRLLCADAGIPFLPQAFIPGVGDTDGQIGPHTYVEVDGSETHDTPEGIANDARRSAAAAAKGARLLRFRYRQYQQQWSSCVAAMYQALEEDEALVKTPVVRYESPRWARFERRNARMLRQLRTKRTALARGRGR